MPTPIDNLQPAVAVTEAILTAGNYPSIASGGSQGSIAAIRHFAFNFAPEGTLSTQGQLLPISQNTALFSLLGTTYGGDGASNFALPDLDTILSVGSGTGPGLSFRDQGAFYGIDDLFLVRSNMLTNLGGASVPFDNTAPSLPVRYLINAFGTYNGGDLTDIGMVWEFAGVFAPGGTLECNGQLVLITEYETLFNLIGTTYGGDGQTTFAVPDLRGRTIVGSSNAGDDLGRLFGTETQTVGGTNLPAEMNGGAQPLDNHGPSLVLRYMIAIQGIFPTQDEPGNTALDGTTPLLGEIVATAGNTIPNGWLECNGQLLAINQNQALFALLGTMYGGNGQTNFALPDLRGRALVGADSSDLVGTIYGDDQITLTLDNIPDLYVTGTDAAGDLLFGANEGDSLFGLADHDTLTAYGGNDYLDGGGGDDTMRGGGGDDAYVVDSYDDLIEENAAEGADTVGTALEVYSIGGLANVENLTGMGDVDQELTGNNGNNRIDGGLGADLMEGSLGDDTYVVDNVGDVASEGLGWGNDTVLSSISFALGANVENLTLTGVAAINANGNGLANILIGNGAANLLNGGAGADSMQGGDGDDTYYVENAGDGIVEAVGAGADRVFSTVSHRLASNVENLTLLGAATINGSGNGLGNLLIGNDAANVLNGGAGADSMRGGLGNDSYYVENAGDTIVEHSDGGTDRVFSSLSLTLSANLENLILIGAGDVDGTGNGRANVIVGNAAANRLAGGNGADVLRGSGGDDILVGGAGNDNLGGGAGADTFQFDSALSAADNVDVIVDFSVADDGIALNRAIFVGLTDTGALPAAAFHAGTAAADGDDRVIYDASTGRLYYDADGDGAGAQILFARVTAGLPLTADDFTVFGPPAAAFAARPLSTETPATDPPDSALTEAQEALAAAVYQLQLQDPGFWERPLDWDGLFCT